MTERETDLELVRRAQSGDQAAFAMLVAKYQQRVARLLYSMMLDHNEIEDVTQETFIKAYRSLPSFRGDSAFYTWLYRVAINAGKNFRIKQIRRRVKRTVSSEDIPEEAMEAERLRDHQTPELILLSKQIGMTVDKAMDALPPDLRIALTLREIEGLSYEEIATVMDCPLGTVRSRIFRAREAVAEKLKPLIENVSGKRLI
jgi:RNA polymerase sigma factor RpoE